MKPHRFRWSKVYESSEEELLSFLQARSISAERHDISAFDTFSLVQHRQQETTLWCAEGSMTVHIGDGGTTVSVQPGDAIRTPTGTSCDIAAGISGCVYFTSDS